MSDEKHVAELALPWAAAMPDDDLNHFLNDLVSAAMHRWQSDPDVPDREVLALVERACAQWRTPGEGWRSDAPNIEPPEVAELERLRSRVAELEAAQGSFLLPWAHQLDAKSLDNFVIDLARAADAPLLFVVDEIHQTVAQWRELVAEKAAEEAVSRSVDAQFPLVAELLEGGASDGR